MSQTRQPKGIPVGGQFAANAHDEAGASLASASTAEENRYTFHGEEFSESDLIERMIQSGDLSPAARDMPAKEVFEQYHQANALEHYDDDFVARVRPQDEPEYPIGFPTGGDTTDKVDWALENDCTLLVDMDAGAFRLSGSDLDDTYQEMAPGEAFVVIGAWRNDVDASLNPYGASAEAISEADRITNLIAERGVEDPDVIAEIKEKNSDPAVKADYYNAMASHMTLSDERRERLAELMEEHQISRAAIDKEIGNEFGMPIEYQDGDTTRMYSEHPNRIINRITDDYLEEVVESAARNFWD